MNHPNATGHAPRRSRRGYLAGFREVSTALASNSGSTSTGCSQGSPPSRLRPWRLLAGLLLGLLHDTKAPLLRRHTQVKVRPPPSVRGPSVVARLQSRTGTRHTRVAAPSQQGDSRGVRLIAGPAQGTGELTTIEALSRCEAHVAVVGLGYVGTPLMAAPHRHFSVYGFDTYQRCVAALQRGVDVTGSADACRIRDMRERFITDAAALGRRSLVIVAVPTPITSEHRPGLEPHRAAARTIGQNIRRRAVVIVESTVYPGVTEEVVGAIIADESGLRAGEGCHLGYSPKRINPGADPHALERPVKVVAGECTAVTDLMTALYGKVTGGMAWSTGVNVTLSNIKQDKWRKRRSCKLIARKE